MTQSERFWAKVEKGSSCWLWKAAKNNMGYGMFWDGSKLQLAHRYVLGCPDGIVMHSCDTPLCVNPEHLSIGTQKENIRDAMQKGRCRGGKPQITLEQAREIKSYIAQGCKEVDIMTFLGVSRGVVSGIRHNKSWSHA